MRKEYTVLSEWFKRKDQLNCVIGSWCKKLSNIEVLCIICDSSINCEKKGFAALTQHVKTRLHEENAALKLAANQLLLTPRPVGTFMCITATAHDAADKNQAVNQLATLETKSKPAAVSLFHSEEHTVRVELIWAMKCVQENISPSACDDLRDIFMAMFPNAVPENFSLGRTKLSYLITEALGPYFFEAFIEDLKNVPYTLLFDETTNNSNQKELQTAVRYWSEKDKEVAYHHLRTVFMGHATAEDLSKQIKIILSRAGLSFKNLLMLGSDGPRVNQKVFRIMNDIITEERGSGLIDVGTCNLHVIHNTFLKGLVEYGDVAKELIVDVYHYFKKFPSRWKDFMVIQSHENCPSNRFLKHTSTRWLTMAPAARRLLSQWPAIIEYFLKFVPLKQPHLMSREKYKRISNCLKYVDIKVELQFVVESAELFDNFLTLFQTSTPLIHVLYSEMVSLLKNIAGRICKVNTSIHKPITNKKLLPVAELFCGEKIEKLLSELKVSDQKLSKHKMQQHYFSAFKYLKDKVLHSGKTIKYMQCLKPSEVTNVASLNYACNLAKAFSFLKVAEMKVRDEWLILQGGFTVDAGKDVRIDHVWRDVFEEKTSSGFPKYPHITTLVKACLTLSHGNSDVERGFSVSQRILSEEKASMSEKMLNARLNVRDGLRKYNSVSEIPIYKSLLKMAYSASKSYRSYLEEEKRLKEQKAKEVKEKEEEILKLQQKKEEVLEKKEVISSLESKVKLMSQAKKTTQATADVLLKEGNERLKRAIVKNDLGEIRVSQSMLEAAEKLRLKERDQEKKALELGKIVDKRKSKLIDYLSKDPKRIKKA